MTLFCDDVNCVQLEYGVDDDNCALGFKNRLRVPKSIADTYHLGRENS
jgi:hypothetical protein